MIVTIPAMTRMTAMSQRMNMVPPSHRDSSPARPRQTLVFRSVPLG